MWKWVLFNLATPHKLFETYLTKSQSRYTSQKRQIVDQIFKNRRHFEVEDFIEQLRNNEVSFSRATVYRTIKQLLEAGLIQKIPTQDGKVFYEGTRSKKQHDHLICNVCGKILEIKEDYVEKYLQQYCESVRFNAEYRSLHIYGQCSDCRV